MRKLTLASAALVLSALVAVDAWAQFYHLTNLGVLTGDNQTYATAINSSGQVVGYCANSSGTDAAFLYSGGALHSLGTLGGTWSESLGINDSGNIVGSASTSSGQAAAFYLSSGTMMQVPGTSACAINNHGLIVGWDGGEAFENDSSQPIGFPSMSMCIFPIPTGEGAPSESGMPIAVNNSGQIALTAYWPNEGAFFFNPSTWEWYTLASGPSDPWCATGINDAGQIVGWATNVNNWITYGCVWNTRGGPELTLSPLGGTSCEANGINNSGQIVGTSTNSAGANVAFRYNNGTMQDLNSLVSAPGWTLQDATAINSAGQIIGYGTDGGQTRGFLLTPLEPGDANGDGRVDINDLTTVLANYGQTGMTWTQGEFTGDGTVDINDLTIVLANYNTTYGASAAGVKAVPEPSCAVLLGAACVLAFAWRRRTT